MSGRVGFFAGTFDPIHDGHIEVARSCVEYLELKNLYIMVEANPWGEKNPVSVGHRQAMVELAIGEEADIEQLKTQANRFTIEDTLPKLEQKFEDLELYFIFGADIFMHMNPDTWPQLHQLLKHYIVVIERKSITEKEITEHAKLLGIVTAILPSPHPQHSSSDVRLKPHNKLIWVPEAVAGYIDQNNLYVS